MTFFERIKAMIVDASALPPIARLIGFQPVEAEHGRVVLELGVDERLHNAVGTLHGGVLCDVADAAMGLAYATTVAPEDSFTTVELKINYLRPVWKGRLRIVGRVVSAGRNLGLTEAEIFDTDGKMVARASSTCMTLRGAQAKGR